MPNIEKLEDKDGSLANAFETAARIYQLKEMEQKMNDEVDQSMNSLEAKKKQMEDLLAKFGKRA